VLLADTKIVDGGEIEAADAFAAGANIVTVLGVAEDETIRGVVRAAENSAARFWWTCPPGRIWRSGTGRSCAITPIWNKTRVQTRVLFFCLITY